MEVIVIAPPVKAPPAVKAPAPPPQGPPPTPTRDPAMGPPPTRAPPPPPQDEDAVAVGVAFDWGLLTGPRGLSRRCPKAKAPTTTEAPPTTETLDPTTPLIPWIPHLCSGCLLTLLRHTEAPTTTETLDTEAPRKSSLKCEGPEYFKASPFNKEENDNKFDFTSIS